MGYEKKKKRSKGALPAPSMPDKDWEKRYEAEEDLRAFARVEACKKDPGRMKRMRSMAKEKLAENQKRQAELATMVNIGKK